MISEIEIFCRDFIRFDILSEAVSGAVDLIFQLNGGKSENYMTDIHSAESRVKIYGKFNISENPVANTISVRPVMISDGLKITPVFNVDVSDKSVLIVRSATKEVEMTYPFSKKLKSLVLVPNSANSYMLKIDISDSEDQSAVHEAEVPVRQNNVFEPSLNMDFNNSVTAAPKDSADNVAQTEVSAVNNDLSLDFSSENSAKLVHAQQENHKVSESEHLEQIEHEYQKDYNAKSRELDEIKARMEADSSVIEYYKDKDVVPIEKIFEEINQKLQEAEEQISLFIKAKQQKTMEIEGEIKSNNR